MKPALRSLLGVTLVGLILGAGYDGYHLVRGMMQNDAIAHSQSIAADERRPYAVFANASRTAASGDYLRALNLYRQVIQDAPAALKTAARYNSANLHLREAIRIRTAGDPATVVQTLPLLELAKLGYRDVLREEPQHWDARFNLERALLLAPEGDEAEDVTAPPMYNDRGNPTVKGIPPGLP